MKRPGNNTQTLIGTLIGSLTAAIGAWQINSGNAEALEHALETLDTCHATVQQIALRVSGMMEEK